MERRALGRRALLDLAGKVFLFYCIVYGNSLVYEWRVLLR